MANYVVDPAPKNTELLYNYKVHRAFSVFHGYNNDAVEVRRGDRTFWSDAVVQQIPNGVMWQIEIAGFKGIFDIGYIQCDNPLITALIERWRPETHTFHLPCVGEVTVTLQDVQILWGLNVNGPVVSGTDISGDKDTVVSMLINQCETLLGFKPKEDHIKGSRLMKDPLLKELKTPLAYTDDASKLQAEIRRARCYILFLLGFVIFPDKSGTQVPLRFLQNITDLKECGKLSWASAVLASLYRNLCKATKPTVRGISGPTILLMHWTWANIPKLCPSVNNEYNFQKVYGARWTGKRDFHNSTAHYLLNVRDVLSSLTDKDFLWTPYRHILHRFPSYLTRSLEQCRCDTYVVFWDIVEPYLPSRVKRQFGIRQDIPTNVLVERSEHKEFHKDARLGNERTDWMVKHTIYISRWNERVASMINGYPVQHSNEVVNGYYTWYRERTVIYIVRPGQNNSNILQSHRSDYDILVEGHARLAAGLIQPDDQQSVSQIYLNLVGAGQPQQDTFIRYTDDPTGEISNPVLPEQLGRRGGANRPRRQRRNQAEFDLNTDGAGPSNVYAEAEPSNVYAEAGPSNVYAEEGSSHVYEGGHQTYDFLGSGPLHTQYGGPLANQADDNQNFDFLGMGKQNIQYGGTSTNMVNEHVDNSSMSDWLGLDLQTHPNI